MEIWIEGKFESLSLEMDVIGRKILFLLIYKPPSASFEDFKHGFESLMGIVSSSRLEYVCMGDFNYDLKNLIGFNLDFLNLMLSYNLYPVTTIPTRLTTHSATFIDNVFVTGERIRTTHADIILTPVSDHLQTLACLKVTIRQTFKGQQTSFRDLKANNLKNFPEEMKVIS